ncbi:MAG: CopG family transcriptional regulator [Nanoarchaeota archaeon]|nr:CopG family transcriptional regulator [Nanoarchaeota archaeon]
MTTYTTVSIPVELAKKVKKLIKNTGFKSLSDYVTFVLREIVAGKSEFDRGEIEHVKKRLKSLGYL